MTDSGVDVTLLSVGADLPYFTGYEAMASERLTVLVVTPASGPVMFIPQLEAPRVTANHVEVRAWDELEDPVDLAASLANSPGRIAVGVHMWSLFLTRFQKRWTGADWVPASTLTSPMRLLKDAEEIDLMRRAAHAVDRVMDMIPDGLQFSGRSEAQVARNLAELTVAEGHDEAAFTIVASGPNGASPHHHPGDRVMGEGDLVVCDFGGRLGGYYSDSTRTFVVGTPSHHQLEVHAAVAAANEAGRSAVAPGVPCQEIDRAARAVIDQAGFGEFFIHRTGHGIGLEVHEHPYMVEGNDQILQRSMTFSVEPGIYMPDELGVRIEDIVVCTDEGPDSLNRASRELTTVA
jgi:D-alanyl-D-alanine dipeptidase